MSVSEPHPVINGVIILDINGVLADVRKIQMPEVPPGYFHSKDIYNMPNGQIVYLRPGIIPVLSDVIKKTRETNLSIGIWTSRLRKNALPILQFLESQILLYRNNGMMPRQNPKYIQPPRCTLFDFCLTGESCVVVPNSDPTQPPAMLKSIAHFRDMTRYQIKPDCKLLFFDDSKIKLIDVDANTSIQECSTYNALSFIERFNRHLYEKQVANSVKSTFLIPKNELIDKKYIWRDMMDNEHQQTRDMFMQAMDFWIQSKKLLNK